MATIPVSHVTETDGAFAFPWVVRCQSCGREVARLNQEELTAMVMTERVEPVFCFSCESIICNAAGISNEDLPQYKLAPWTTISVMRSLLGFI